MCSLNSRDVCHFILDIKSRCEILCFFLPKEAYFLQTLFHIVLFFFKYCSLSWTDAEVTLSWCLTHFFHLYDKLRSKIGISLLPLIAHSQHIEYWSLRKESLDFGWYQCNHLPFRFWKLLCCVITRAPSPFPGPQMSPGEPHRPLLSVICPDWIFTHVRWQ